MGLLKKAADTVYAFRFIRMLVLDWKDWDAYKQGIIDENGKRVKSVKIDNLEKSSVWTPFIRLCANIKRLISKAPGGGSRLGSFAAALFLIKEKTGMSDKEIKQICEKVPKATRCRATFLPGHQKPCPVVKHYFPAPAPPISG